MNDTKRQHNASSSPGPVIKEYRFAVVMYGGVSLAIYMNGIAQELLHLVRATARTRGKGKEEYRYALGPDSESADESRYAVGTEPVYRELAEELARELDPTQGGDGAPRLGVRFIVDLISGTSAGGINGVFLAKALANGQSMQRLTSMWIEEGDINKLLYDRRSALPNQGLRATKSPASLLNGDRMYLKLLDALDGMGPTEGGSLVQELDLFVTTTDIRGLVIPLRTYDRLIYERQYKYAFQFRYEHDAMESETNDFVAKNNPFLAFASRCTSSFPFAFEPMTLERAKELLCGLGQKGRFKTDWVSRFFAPRHQPGHSSMPAEKRPFGDGGYLNNKPFSYAIDALRTRSSDVPSTRILVYIEPAPEHPERDTDPNRLPDAIENSTAAMITLPDFQPIQDDLLRINERNRLLRKLNSIIDSVSGVMAEPGWKPLPKLTPELGIESMRTGNQRQPLTYVTYLLLQVYDVSDRLAEIIAHLAGYERDTSYFFAIRCLVRAWRESYYERDKEWSNKPKGFPAGELEGRDAPAGRTLTAFLLDYNLWYYLRRVRFLENQVDQAYTWEPSRAARLAELGVIPSRAGERGTGARTNFLEGLADAKKHIDAAFRSYRQAYRTLHEDAQLRLAATSAEAKQLWERVLGIAGETATRWAPQEGDNAENDYMDRARGELKDSNVIQGLNKFAAQVNRIIRKAAKGAATHLAAIRDEHPGGGGGAWGFVQRMLDQFPEYDASIYPIMYETDLGELNRVETIRFSPEDAVDIVDESRQQVKKLRGIWLGHFGAFLDDRWREMDILWGRLDGAERIIRSLLPTRGERPHPEAEKLIRKATDRILEEYLGRRTYQELVRAWGLQAEQSPKGFESREQR